MKRDISGRDDLRRIIHSFYDLLLGHERMHPIFRQFEEKDLRTEHENTLVDFWDGVLFFSGTYKKNAMEPHRLLHEKSPLLQEHFDIWMTLFRRAADLHFEGENTEVLKNRALSIATVMQLKFGIVK